MFFVRIDLTLPEGIFFYSFFYNWYISSLLLSYSLVSHSAYKQFYSAYSLRFLQSFVVSEPVDNW